MPHERPNSPIQQAEVLKNTFLSTVISSSGADKSRAKELSKQGHEESRKHSHKKQEKSPSMSSSKKRTSSVITSKLSETAHSSYGSIRSSEEHGADFPGPTSKSTLKPSLTTEQDHPSTSEKKMEAHASFIDDTFTPC